MVWVGVLITRRCMWLRNLPYQYLTSLPLRYFTPSLVNKTIAYDYDLESGAVSHRRDFIEGTALNLPANSFCDGLCIDSEGCIWSARFVTVVTSVLYCRHDPAAFYFEPRTVLISPQIARLQDPSLRPCRYFSDFGAVLPYCFLSNCMHLRRTEQRPAIRHDCTCT